MPQCTKQLLSPHCYFSTDRTLHLLRETRFCFQARNCRDLPKRQFPPPLPLPKEFPQEKKSPAALIQYYKPLHPHCIQIPPCYHGERRSSSFSSPISSIKPPSALMHMLISRRQNGQQDKTGEIEKKQNKTKNQTCSWHSLSICHPVHSSSREPGQSWGRAAYAAASGAIRGKLCSYYFEKSQGNGCTYYRKLCQSEQQCVLKMRSVPCSPAFPQPQETHFQSVHCQNRLIDWGENFRNSRAIFQAQVVDVS